MAELQCFDDRTIQRVRRAHTGGKVGSGDDPIASHTKMIQDHHLGNLSKLAARAEDRAYETNAGLQGETDVLAEVDPSLNYEENVGLLKEKLGVKFRTEAKNDARDARADQEHKQRRYAAETIRENFNAIQSGEADKLRSDIESEFSESFVLDVLAVEEAERVDPGAGDIPDLEPEPTSDPAPDPIATAELVAEPTPEPVESTSTGDYDGIIGFLGLMVDYTIASFREGVAEGAGNTAKTPQRGA